MTEKEKETLATLVTLIDHISSGNNPQHIGKSTIEPTGNPAIDELADSIIALCEQYNQNYPFILNLSQGKLDSDPPPRNSFATPFKQLQSELRYLTWQIQQIADGDYNQRVSFSGDFAQAINKMILVLRDRQVLSDLLEESNQTKDKLFSIIAHDLKNPFNTLIGMSEVLLGELATGNTESAKVFAQMINDAAYNGYTLLINLLEWSRLQTGRISVKPEHFDLKDIALGNINLIKPTALSKNITIEYTDPNEYPILSDDTILNTILRNLLSNAVKYSRLGGVVQVIVEKVENCYLVTVKDNGVGMKEEDVQKLFRIETLKSTQGTCDEQGTGLGLILCKDFIHKIGGEIKVESVHGEGTTFTLTVPDLTKIADK